MNAIWMNQLADLSGRARECMAAGNSARALDLLYSAKSIIDAQKHSGAGTSDVVRAEKSILRLIGIASSGRAHAASMRGVRSAA